MRERSDVLEDVYADGYADGSDADPREVGLEDLLGVREPLTRPIPVPAGDPLQGAPRWLLGRAFFAIALGLVCYGLLYLTRWLVPYPLLVATIFVITVLKHGISQVAGRPLPAELTGRGLRRGGDGADAGAPGGLRDGVALAVGAWDARLHLAERGGNRSSRLVLSRLRELVDERLWSRHGVTRGADPRRTRQMMGEQLWTTLQESNSGVRTPRDMAPLVTRIEQL